MSFFCCVCMYACTTDRMFVWILCMFWASRVVYVCVNFVLFKVGNKYRPLTNGYSLKLKIITNNVFKKNSCDQWKGSTCIKKCSIFSFLILREGFFTFFVVPNVPIKFPKDLSSSWCVFQNFPNNTTFIPYVLAKVELSYINIHTHSL